MDLEKVLAEIKEALAKATPGPWAGKHRHVDCTVDDDESCGLGLEIKGPPQAGNRGQFARGADVKLIVALRNHAPLLIAALRLRVTGAAVLEANDSGDDDAFEDAQAAHDKALAEFEALAEGE